MKGSNLLSLEIDYPDYVLDCDVMVDWYYDPGCWYDRNGDPGRPPEFDWDFEIVHIAKQYEDDRVEVDAKDFDDYREAIEEKISSLSTNQICQIT